MASIWNKPTLSDEIIKNNEIFKDTHGLVTGEYIFLFGILFFFMIAEEFGAPFVLFERISGPICISIIFQ